MPYITYKVFFENEVNESLQAKPSTVASATSNDDIGAWDRIYYVNIASGIQSEEIEFFGDCTAISSDKKTIDVYVDTSTALPDPGAFFFFGKNSSVNTSGLTGYYADVELRNDSTSSVELFSVNSEVIRSSK